MSSSTPPIGAHLSVAGGYSNAIERATSIGADALQIFSASPRVWARPTIDESALQEFSQQRKEKSIRKIFVHAMYLVNLISTKAESVQKSKNALVYDLDFGSYFDCDGVVVHLGSHQGRGWEAVKDELVLQIQNVIDSSRGKTPFLIENSAGQKGKLTSQLEEIRWLIDQVDRPQLGWCYDTCHGWAAGYAEVQSGGQEKHLFEAIDELELWETLKCVHVNDSRDPFASGRDRHANIHEGTIPSQEWEALWYNERFRSVPMITEVPGLDGNGPDEANIQRIHQLFDTI